MSELDNKENNIVASFIINKDLHKRLKLFAVANGYKLKDALDQAIREFLERHEK
jgi:hypothetical protein